MTTKHCRDVTGSNQSYRAIQISDRKDKKAQHGKVDGDESTTKKRNANE